MKSLNKVQLIGHLGGDPEIRTMDNGKKLAVFTMATTRRWKNKNTGVKTEATQWHKVVVYNPAFVNVCENYLNKGALVLVEGAIESRSYDHNGETRYVTEIILRPFGSELILLDRVNRAAVAATNADTPEIDSDDKNPAPNVADPAAAFNAPPVDHAAEFFPTDDELEEMIPF